MKELLNKILSNLKLTNTQVIISLILLSFILYFLEYKKLSVLFIVIPMSKFITYIYSTISNLYSKKIKKKQIKLFLENPGKEFETLLNKFYLSASNIVRLEFQKDIIILTDSHIIEKLDDDYYKLSKDVKYILSNGKYNYILYERENKQCVDNFFKENEHQVSNRQYIDGIIRY